jgi:hypothetical protein
MFRIMSKRTKPGGGLSGSFALHERFAELLEGPRLEGADRKCADHLLSSRVGGREDIQPDMPAPGAMSMVP